MHALVKVKGFTSGGKHFEEKVTVVKTGDVSDLDSLYKERDELNAKEGDLTKLRYAVRAVRAV
jgi:hypothetical protein